ncbi:palmitoyltransferase swf1 [Basidiobolus ranarum]|uniref:Palmitoyltransferase n=1 Tax=Basidiobolus ranarum TaxID=34480 RepID=A0ABR2VM56_9FUNG
MGLVLLAVAIVTLVFFVFLMLLGPSQRFRNTWIGHLHQFFTEDFIDILQDGIKRLLGRRLYGLLKKIFTYVAFEANPLVQVLYLALLTVGVYVFFKDGWTKIPGPYASETHRYFIPPVVFITYLSFALVSFSNPGVVNESNVRRACEMFSYDYINFKPKTCTTCCLQKPARSKHCSMCKACIARSDHHCIWVNNCVGLNNHRYFIAFLSSTAITCIYASVMIAKILYGEIARQDLLNSWYWDPDTRQRVQVTLFKALSMVINTNVNLGALGIFCALCSIIVTVFFLAHLYTLSDGTTTNESFKWEDVKEAVEDGRLYMKSQTSQDSEMAQILHFDQVSNIYDQGRWKNIWRFIVPEQTL